MLIETHSDHFLFLKELVGLLTSKEKRIAALHIGGFDMADTSHNKGLQLFNLLVKRKTLTKLQAKSIVSMKSQERTFDRLCSTTLTKVTESLTLAINNEQKPYSKFARTRYAVHRHYDEASILMLKGASNLAAYRLKKALRASSKLELFAERLQLTTEWKWLMAAQSNLKAWKKYEILEREAEECYTGFRKVVSAFVYHQMMADRAGTGKYPIEQLRLAVAQADNIIEQTGAVTIEYWGRQLKMEYYAFHNCHVLYRHEGRKLIELVQSYKNLFKRSSLPNLYLQVAQCESRLYHFNAAVDASTKAISLLQPGRHNRLMAQQERALMYFYLGKYAETISCLLAIKNGRFRQFFDDPELQYLLAYAYFKQGDHKSALRIVRTITAFDEEQAGYNIGLRILEALIQVELADFTGLEATLAAFSSYVRGGAGLAAARPRDLAIATFLKIVLSVSLDYNKAATTGAGTLAKLSSTDPSYCWRVRSHELLLTHQYFESRAQGKPYDPTVPQSIKDAVRVDEEKYRIGAA